LKKYEDKKSFSEKWKEKLDVPNVSPQILFTAIADLKKDIHDCPSNLVNLTCEGFVVPPKQILHIS